jgi:hypothetical protein
MTPARRAELEARANEAIDLVYARVDRDGDLNWDGRNVCVQELITMLQQVEREVWEKAAQIVERHGSHPVKHGEPMPAWVATPFYEKSKEIAREIRQQHEGQL